jgi:hypothetical protein
MRAGKAIRDARADANWRCLLCKHADPHCEAPSTWALVDGVPVESISPDYQAGVFTCTAPGCGCVLDRTKP